MKSIVFSRYGTTADPACREVDTPVPGDHEVLVRIRASSVNDWDWVLMRGKSPINRLMFGLFRPRVKTLGIDSIYPLEQVPQALEHFGSGMAKGKIVIAMDP